MQGCIFAQNRIFLPPKMILSAVKISPFPRFSTSSSFYLRFFLLNHHIFSQGNQFFICLLPPPPGAGGKWKIYTSGSMLSNNVMQSMISLFWSIRIFIGKVLENLVFSDQFFSRGWWRIRIRIKLTHITGFNCLGSYLACVRTRRISPTHAISHILVSPFLKTQQLNYVSHV